MQNAAALHFGTWEGDTRFTQPDDFLSVPQVPDPAPLCGSLWGGFSAWAANVVPMGMGSDAREEIVIVIRTLRDAETGLLVHPQWESTQPQECL